MSAFMVNPAPPTSSKNLDARAQAQKSILRAKDSLVEEKTAENLAPGKSWERVKMYSQPLLKLIVIRCQWRMQKHQASKRRRR